jgi:hypothetical protein
MEDSSWDGRHDQEEGVADDDHGNNAKKKRKRGGGTGEEGPGSVQHAAKNWEGRVHQSMSERGECEGVTRGATGGQRRGRNEYRRSQKGRTRKAHARACTCVHVSMTRKTGSKTRQTWVLRNGGFLLGGQKRPGRVKERRREWLTAIVAMTQEKEKEGRRGGEEGPGSVQHAKIGRGGCANRRRNGRSARG